MNEIITLVKKHEYGFLVETEDFIFRSSDTLFKENEEVRVAIFEKDNNNIYALVTRTNGGGYRVEMWNRTKNKRLSNEEEKFWTNETILECIAFLKKYGLVSPAIIESFQKNISDSAAFIEADQEFREMAKIDVVLDDKTKDDILTEILSFYVKKAKYFLSRLSPSDNNFLYQLITYGEKGAELKIRLLPFTK